MPFVETRHVGDDGKRPAAGTARRWASSRCAARGSPRRTSATRATDRFTTDGWFKTGDVVTIDAEGYVRITDRSKDVIKSGGEWISSVALENALMSHPAVLEAAVFAGAHDKWDERPIAAVVSRPGTTATADELRAHLADRVRQVLAARRLRRSSQQIPRTSTGKFLKTKLREEYGGMLRGRGWPIAVDPDLAVEAAAPGHLFEEMPVAFVGSDGEGILRVWNHEAERVSGHLRAELLGDPRALDLLGDDGELARLLEQARSGAPVRDVRSTLRRPDGERRTVSWSSRAREVVVPGLASWLMGVDVTERDRIRSRLLLADRMASGGYAAPPASPTRSTTRSPTSSRTWCSLDRALAGPTPPATAREARSARARRRGARGRRARDRRSCATFACSRAPRRSRDQLVDVRALPRGLPPDDGQRAPPPRAASSATSGRCRRCAPTTAGSARCS